ncbi:MAG TPA: HIT family protein [Candidatus Saccharimonadales bacterium]|nr:HIT family protein [Candidatus Saccharimonadales bacterium]
MSDCIFCKVLSGDIPVSKVYEDEKVLAFLDIRPINPGQCLVVPKIHVDHFTDLPDELAAHIMITAKKIGHKLKEILKPTRVGYNVHGFGVPHAHLSVIPLQTETDITSAKAAYIKDGEVAFDEDRIKLADKSELDKNAELLRT